MKRALSGFLACAFTAGCAAGLAACGEQADREGKAFDAPDAEISAEVKGDGTRISDRLFGVFLEDINYASYLMDDNLISNGSFEYSEPARGWNAVGGATITTLRDSGVSSTNRSYLRIEAQENGGIENKGYTACPMAVTQGKTYRFSAFVRAGSYEGNLIVRIADGQKTYAEKKIAVKAGGDWVKYKTSLVANASVSANLTCKILLESAGELELDAVALETEESTVGFKNYAYDALKNLSPKFIRFPGGCVIEGKSAESAYDWKNSIGVDGTGKASVLTYREITEGAEQTVTTTGEPSTRTPNRDIWQVGNEYYNMEYGIGFYEYFMLCDSLGASAIPIVSCGISCMIQTSGTGNYTVLLGRNGNGVKDYIQDALDLVAFAKGSVTSSDPNEAYWAKVRTDMGHAEPFDMTYLGIGNEQWGAYYGYYEQFLRAFEEAKIKNSALYGDIRLIVGNGVSINDVEKYGKGGTAKAAAKEYMASGKITSLSEYGVQDHHYYMNYSDFFRYAQLYDSYTRGGADGYEVFVGEYSANDVTNPSFPTEKNSWMTALSEAAYMTGLERNGDVVTLAAYAPVFGNVNHIYNQWQVDMMYYTNTELLYSANYYVQQLFAANAGSRVYAAETEYADGFEKQVKLGNNVRVNRLYHVIGKDDATGDIVIKIVNAGIEDVAVNFDLSGIRPTGIAHVTELQCDTTTAVNTLAKEKIAPEKYTLGVKSKFGYTARKYSVTAIRVHVK